MVVAAVAVVAGTRGGAAIGVGVVGAMTETEIAGATAAQHILLEVLLGILQAMIHMPLGTLSRQLLLEEVTPTLPTTRSMATLSSTLDMRLTATLLQVMRCHLVILGCRRKVIPQVILGCHLVILHRGHRAHMVRHQVHRRRAVPGPPQQLCQPQREKAQRQQICRH